MNDNRPFLLKIHGDAEERSGRVLTRREYDRHYAAAEAFREAIQCLRPFFLRLLQAFRPLMADLVDVYIPACEAARVEVDSALLGEILPLLRGEQGEAAEAR